MLRDRHSILDDLRATEGRLIEFINREGGLEIQKEWHKENLERIREKIWEVSIKKEIEEIKQLLEDMKSSPIKNSEWHGTISTLKARLKRLEKIVIE